MATTMQVGTSLTRCRSLHRPEAHRFLKQLGRQGHTWQHPAGQHVRIQDRALQYETRQCVQPNFMDQWSCRNCQPFTVFWHGLTSASVNYLCEGVSGALSHPWPPESLRLRELAKRIEFGRRFRDRFPFIVLFSD
jgi:hypothetical protein